MKSIVTVFMVTLIIVSMFTLAFNVWPVNASGTIYIRADGSIDPPTAPISTVDYVTYTFTDNIYDEIVVERDNITIDGTNYTVEGTGSGTGIDLSFRSNVTVQNVEVTNFNGGIKLASSSNNTLTGNTASNNDLYGIYLGSSSFNIVSGNNITANNYNGVWLNSSSHNSIQGNNITATNYDGIWLYSSSNYNSISGNNITANNFDGIGLYLSSFNIVSGNNITANNQYGIRLSGSSNNRVFHNNLINNTNQVYSFNSVNIWDDGYPSGGNYWSNYTGVDSDHNGIGDTSYTIYANCTDNYPLMGMFSSFNTSLGKYTNIISNSTIEDFTYFESNSTIRMHVSNMTGNQTHGFVRITIPHDLMTEPYNITIDGVNPTYWNYTLYDNGTHRWIYFEYEHSTVEVVIIPEFPVFIILPLLMTLVVLATLVYRRKRI